MIRDEERRWKPADCLEGKLAIVTGAAQGLGFAFARALAGAGARTALVDVRESVADAANAIASAGAETRAFVADVSRASDVRRVVDAVHAEMGPCCALVNNAGRFAITKPDDAWEKAVADFDSIAGVNLRGSFLFGRAVIPAMLAQREGQIVNISTDHVLPPPGRETGGGPAMDVYDASKWALNGLTQAWARALAKKGVRVNALCMGATDTEMLRGFYGGSPPPQELATWLQPAQIAQTLLDLLREGPGGRTGQNIGLWVGHPLEMPQWRS